MINELFVAALSVLVSVLFVWAFRKLPRAEWQVLASVPIAEEGPHQWRGVNFTYYGVFVATALVASLSIYLVLVASVGASVAGASAVAGMILAISLPAAKLVARLVEKKKHTFTVGGASFLGILCTPAAIWIVDRGIGPGGGISVAPVAVMAALSIAYAFGEGLGRLACISFGCCYGKPMADCPDIVRRLLQGRGFVFSGETKKVAYEGGFEGCEVVPVQALTAIICTAASLAGMLFYFRGFFFVAFALTLTVTQAWRAVSEALRADYRGGGSVSAYQIMAGIALIYSMTFAWSLREGPSHIPDFTAGLVVLWDPAVVLCLEALWILSFLYTGRSVITGAALSFHVHEDRT